MVEKHGPLQSTNYPCYLSLLGSVSIFRIICRVSYIMFIQKIGVHGVAFSISIKKTPTVFILSDSVIISSIKVVYTISMNMEFF